MQKSSGRAIVKYEQLLKMAHERGLLSLRSFLVQVPSSENGWVAICRAEAIFKNADGRETLWEEIGDAGPANTAGAVATAPMRMAATRAKARVLRDAVNVGTVSVEELSEYEEASYQSAPARTNAAPQVKEPKPAPNPMAPATDAQKKAITSLLTKRGIDPEAWITEMFDVGIDNMTGYQAGELLTSLQKKEPVAA